LLRCILFLLPSFVTSRIISSSVQHERSQGRLGPTSYLDGMRGLAALFVFFCHYSYSAFAIADGYGSNNENRYLLKLPIFRLLYAGPPMVAIFFIVSGYALSLKPLKLARSQRWGELSTTMSSFIFRRAFRLFLPTFISTFMVVVLLRLGAYEWNREWSLDRTWHWNVQETAPQRLNTTALQLDDWGRNMFDFVHVWGWEKYGGSTWYDVHLWTIPIEFRASMMLFLTLLGTARLRTGLRLGFLALLIAFSYYSDRWEMVLFLVGMGYAELDLIRGAHSDPSTTAVATAPPAAATAAAGEGSEQQQQQQQQQREQQKRHRACALLSRLYWASLALGSLYLLSQPDVNSENTPGWIYLSSLIPDWISDKYRYWQCNGAILFVFCTARVPRMQRVFNSPPVQYLGKISYAVYLMHGPVMHTVGYSIQRWAWEVSGVDGRAQYKRGFVLGAVFAVPVVVWAADVFWRAVDAPVVRFAKWLEGRC
ncbi:acyltransferase 3, partial [Coniella lustricola]